MKIVRKRGKKEEEVNKVSELIRPKKGEKLKIKLFKDNRIEVSVSKKEAPRFS